MLAFPDIPDTVRQRAARVRLVVFDVDGTLTDGRLLFGADGTETKAFHVLDGQGMRLLEDHGISVAWITARESSAVLARAKDLQLTRVFVGVQDKLACLKALCAQLGLDLEAVAYLGDDLADLAVLSQVGLAVAPANAHAWIGDYVHWISPERGGEGAGRRLCDLILEAQGHRHAVMARFLQK